MEVQEIASNGHWGFIDLPVEIILKIFRYLNFGDIQSASLVCRRWFEASQVSEFQSKVLLKFARTHLSDNSYPGNVFLNTSRAFSNIYLYHTSVETVNNFFSHIGPTVEHIVFEKVRITEEQFTAILEKTPNLKALSVIGSFLTAAQFINSEEGRKFLAASLRNIQEITIKKNRYLTDAILNSSTFFTSNVKTITIDSEEFLLNVAGNHTITLKPLHSNDVEECDFLSLTNITGIDPWKIDFIDRDMTDFNTFLKSQKNLVELNLSGSKISDSFMELFCNHLTKLEVLKLQHCMGVSDANIVGVSKLKRLKVLDISFCKISGSGVQQGIAKAKNYTLLKLYLGVNLNLSEDCLIQCAENLPNLQVFDITYCKYGVTDKVVQAIIKNLTWLKFLGLNKCRSITDAGLTGINVCNGLSIKELKGLRILHLGRCYEITDASLKNGLKFLELKKLNLSYCEQISTTGIRALVENCPSIEVLELSYCYNINIECIEVISQRLQRLQVLDITECRQLMDHWEDVVINCKVLRCLITLYYLGMDSRIKELQQSRNIYIDYFDDLSIYFD